MAPAFARHGHFPKAQFLGQVCFTLKKALARVRVEADRQTYSPVHLRALSTRIIAPHDFGLEQLARPATNALQLGHRRHAPRFRLHTIVEREALDVGERDARHLLARRIQFYY